MKFGIRVRLSLMMFLQFYIWGGWFVTLGSYLAANLHASGAQSALAYSTQSWGAIIAPIFAGLIADRYLNAERLLGIVHLIGGVLLYRLAGAAEFGSFYTLLFGYMIIYMPTLALVNTVAFRQMADPSRHFSRIRVWGTLGWIVAGLVISYVFGWDSTAALGAGQLRNTFYMCSIASFILGAYSFTLPATPPPAKWGARVSVSKLLSLDALALLRVRNFLVFFVASILICIPLAFYYQHANQFLTEIHVANATGKQTLGQVSEVAFMLLMPFCLVRLGLKATLLVGMGAWALRYVLFAFGNAHELVWMLLIGIALHGVCYDFFFVSGQIFTDAKVGTHYKSAAQGLITMATYGVGMLIGFSLAGMVSDAYVQAGVHDWRAIWLYPAAFAAVVFATFALCFKNERLADTVKLYEG
jgi:nucleoside transporter